MCKSDICVLCWNPLLVVHHIVLIYEYFIFFHWTEMNVQHFQQMPVAPLADSLNAGAGGVRLPHR